MVCLGTDLMRRKRKEELLKAHDPFGSLQQEIVVRAGAGRAKGILSATHRKFHIQCASRSAACDSRVAVQRVHPKVYDRGALQPYVRRS